MHTVQPFRVRNSSNLVVVRADTKYPQFLCFISCLLAQELQARIYCVGSVEEERGVPMQAGDYRVPFLVVSALVDPVQPGRLGGLILLRCDEHGPEIENIFCRVGARWPCTCLHPCVCFALESVKV